MSAEVVPAQVLAFEELTVEFSLCNLLELSCHKNNCRKINTIELLLKDWLGLSDTTLGFVSLSLLTLAGTLLRLYLWETRAKKAPLNEST